MVAELFDFLKPRATAATFRELCELLAEYGDTELDASVLPVPG